MLRLLNLSLIFVCTIVLSSCLTIEEVLKLNSDGSGTLETTIDMGELLGNPMMKMAMEEEMQKEGKGEMPGRIDSIIDPLAELLPLNPQWTAEEVALLKTMESRMLMDFDKGEGGIYVTIPFNKLNELMRIQKLMAEANEPEGDAGNPFGGMAKGSNVINKFVWKKGKLERNTAISEGAMGGMDMDSEEMSMAKMMFADAKMVFKTVFPGKIKKVKGYPGHSIEDGNVLVQEFGMLDLFDNPEKIDEGLDGQVKYKK